MKRLRAICILGAILALAPAWPLAAQGDLPPYESYYLYLYNHPSAEENDWSADVQGLTHDDNYWYISQTWELWKISVTSDLAPVDDPSDAADYLDLANVNELAGYNHAGDICYYEYGGTGYLLVPLEDNGDPRVLEPGLAVFRAADLGYVAHQLWPETTDGSWCGVDGRGYVYTNVWGYTSVVLAYEINWSHLQTPGQWLVRRAPQKDIHLRTPDGQADFTVQYTQGGDFSDGGQLLYLICGTMESWDWEHACVKNLYDPLRHGIHAFDVATGRQLAHSANGGDPFNYEYNPDYWAGKWHEPEGMTVWDLDDAGVPNVWGQLHVVMLNNDTDTDDVFLKHYSHTIYVDGEYGGEEEKGRFWDPFNTVTEANDYSWDGARIGIRAGRYPEALTLSNRVLLYAFDGDVTLGVTGQMRIAPGAATVRLGHTGAIRLY